MPGDAGYRGISLDHDSRSFSNKDKTLLKTLAHTFPESYKRKVDLRKVNMQVMRPWITGKTEEMLGFEDDVVVEYIMSLLENKDDPMPEPRNVQISLTGFLEAKTPKFMTELWDLLLSAQDSPAGIPIAFVEAKKKEMQQRREADQLALREAAAREVSGSSRQAQSAGARAQNGRSGSRWGPPPPPGRAGGSIIHGAFRDKSRNQTERSQDSGWASRGGDSAPVPQKAVVHQQHLQEHPPRLGNATRSIGRHDYHARAMNEKYEERARYEARDGRGTIRYSDERRSDSSRNRDHFQGFNDYDSGQRNQPPRYRDNDDIRVRHYDRGYYDEHTSGRTRYEDRRSRSRSRSKSRRRSRSRSSSRSRSRSRSWDNRDRQSRSRSADGRYRRTYTPERRRGREDDARYRKSSNRHYSRSLSGSRSRSTSGSRSRSRTRSKPRPRSRSRSRSMSESDSSSRSRSNSPSPPLKARERAHAASRDSTPSPSRVVRPRSRSVTPKYERKAGRKENYQNTTDVDPLRIEKQQAAQEATEPKQAPSKAALSAVTEKPPRKKSRWDDD